MTSSSTSEKMIQKPVLMAFNHVYFIAAEIELPSPVTDRVHQIFLDPTGRHLIVSMNSQDNYYISLGTSAKKPKPITKLKVFFIFSFTVKDVHFDAAFKCQINYGKRQGISFSFFEMIQPLWST